MEPKTYCLCYIDPDTHQMFFTDDMENVWGDDWDDIPYEHNAEEPYRKDKTTEEYSRFTNIVKAVYAKDYDNPLGYSNWLTEPVERYSDGYNSTVSVEEINKKRQIPWLQGYGDALYAGATIEKTKEFLAGQGYKLVMIDEG